MADDETEKQAPPHDSQASEPLGPMTPDDETPLGDTPEHSEEERVATTRRPHRGR